MQLIYKNLLKTLNVRSDVQIQMLSHASSNHYTRYIFMISLETCEYMFSVCSIQVHQIKLSVEKELTYLNVSTLDSQEAFTTL